MPYNPISVVIVNHNADFWLAKCIASVLPQSNEVVVVDNASSDTSLANLVELYPSHDRLQVIRSELNLGFSAGCNLGVSASHEAYILFLNPDCIMDVDSVQKMLEVLKSDASVGMVGGFLVNKDGSEQGGGRRAVPTPWRSFVRASGLFRLQHRWPRLFSDFYLHKQPLPAHPTEVEAISGACMMVRREAMEEVGPWDEGYFLHVEDLDWCMRFHQKNWKIMFVPHARVVHALGACSMKHLIFVEWHKHKGMLRFYRKFFRHQYPGVLMWLVVVGVWLHFGLISGRQLLKKILGRKELETGG